MSNAEVSEPEINMSLFEDDNGPWMDAPLSQSEVAITAVSCRKCNQEKILEFRDNGHLQAISFHDCPRTKIRWFFKSSVKIDFPKRLSILTGENGSGKSSILVYLNEQLTAGQVEGKCVFIKSSATMCQMGSGVTGIGSKDTTYNRKPFEIDAQIHEVLTNWNIASGKCKELRDRAAELVSDELLDRREAVTRAVQEETEKPILHEPCDQKDPVYHIERAMLNYTERVATWNKRLKTREGVAKFRQFCSDMNAEQFLKFYEKDSEALQKKFTECAQANVGKSPIDELNELLEQGGCCFQASYYQEGTGKKGLRFSNGNGRELEVNELSSGYSMIITIFSWLFYESERKEEKNDKVRYLLLDEPDKHLDPKLCKQFFHLLQNLADSHQVQVVMSTHRFDTLAFAPKESIYCVGIREEGLWVKHSTPLEALFRMTSNIRALTNFEIIVFCESTTDAEMHSAVYYALKNIFLKPTKMDTPQMHIPGAPGGAGEGGDDFSAEAVDGVDNVSGGTGDGSDDVSGEGSNSSGSSTSNLPFYPSGRFPLTFRSVSVMKKDGGGCKQVISRVKSIPNAVNALARSSRAWEEQGRMFLDKELYQPYGILDHDYDGVSKVPEGLKNFIVVLPRYAVENIALDPFILCDVLNKELLSMIKLRTQNEDTQNSFTLTTLRIRGMLELLKNQTHSDDHVKNLREMVILYQNLILTVVGKNWGSRNGKRTERSQITSRLLNASSEATTKITVYWSVNASRAEPQRKELEFLSVDAFRNIRGHDIEYYGFKAPQKIVDLITSRAYEKGLSFIPEDVKNTFQELDEKVRRHVRQTYKK